LIRGLISIIVPCFNDGIYLRECLESVIAQTYLEWECIIIDDGSTDNTREVAHGFVERNSRIKYYYHENCGVSASRNYGISVSNGQYILPLDADDCIHKDYLKSAVSILSCNSSVKVVYCKCDYFGALDGPMQLPIFSLSTLSCRNLIFVSALFRKVDFQSIGGYDELMTSGWEDWEFWINLLKDGGDVHQIDKTYFFYRIKHESRNKSIYHNQQEQINLKRYLFVKHSEYFNRYFHDPITVHQKVLSIEAENKKLNLNIEILKKNFYSSRKYRIGHFLLFPFNIFMRILFKKSIK
jgi:glycosyltransferase involved in cell wall biosynthesis